MTEVIIVIVSLVLSIRTHLDIYSNEHPTRQKWYYPLLAFLFIAFGQFCYLILLAGLWRVVSLIFGLGWPEWL